MFGLFLYGIGSYPLLDPDEGRNAEVAREMAETNEYGVPRLNELPYLDKPVFYFAATAAFMEVLGPTPLAARLSSFVFTLATILLVVWFAGKQFGVEGGWTAGIATAATPLTLAFSRTVIFDSTLAFWTTLSIIAFVLAADAKENVAGDEASSVKWIIGAWAALAFGVLTKGPIALAFPLIVVTPYLIWRKRTAVMWDSIGFLLFVAILLPWIYVMSQEVPEFLEYALVVETTKRLFTDELKRTEPFWYFFPILLAGALPWSLVPLAAPKKLWARAKAGGVLDSRFVLLIIWIVIPLLFFTLSKSKRPQYMVPIIPAIGMLVAWFWSKDFGTKSLPGARGAGAALAFIGATLLAARAIVERLIDVSPTILSSISPTALILGSVSLVVGVVVLFFPHKRHVVVMLFAIPVSIIPVSSLSLMQAIGNDRSAAELARAIEPVMTSRTEIVSIKAYPLSLPFYLNRTLTVVTDDAEELTSNYLIRSHDKWAGIPQSPLRPLDWWLDAAVQCQVPRIFIVSSADSERISALNKRLPLIAAFRKYAAFGPCNTEMLARADLQTRNE